jgi:hypothetical protein
MQNRILNSALKEWLINALKAKVKIFGDNNNKKPMIFIMK